MDRKNTVRRRSPQSLLLMLLLSGSLLMVTSCRNTSSPQPESNIEPNPENRLIVADAVLEQSDANGQILWKLQAKEAIYSQDRKAADVTGIVGNLYADGKIILSLKADEGRIINDGERVILRKNIIVTDDRYGAVLEASEAEWQPAEYLLTISADLKGKYPNGQFSATKGQYFIDRQELELEEEVKAIAVKPALQLQSKKIKWQLAEEIITVEEGLELQEYTEEKITARLQAEQGKILLAEEKLVIKGNVLLNNLQPNVQFASGEAAWNLVTDIITGKGGVQITDNKEKIQFRGDTGIFNIKTQQTNLVGAVRGVGKKPPASLSATKLDWNIETQNLLAQGNVVYERQDPRLTLKGDRAVGRLQQNTLVVSGTKGQQVITEVIP
ncbi:MAG: LPS export ABC transporter periplasmic protein LptC [Limnothrix sp.]